MLTPWSRVLLEKQTGFQPVKKFSAFYGNCRFITAVTSARHLFLSWASLIQFIPQQPTSWRYSLSNRHIYWRLPSSLTDFILSFPWFDRTATIQYLNIAHLQSFWCAVSPSPNHHDGWWCAHQNITYSQVSQTLWLSLKCVSPCILWSIRKFLLCIIIHETYLGSSALLMIE